MASEFLQNSQAKRLPTKSGPDGTIRVYDPATNTSAAYNADGSTKTFFKPADGVNCWSEQTGTRPRYVGVSIHVLHVSDLWLS